MPKLSWNDYSATPGSNTDINSINIDEGMAPSLVNNALREMMAQTADVVAGTTALSSINIDGGQIDGVSLGTNSAVTQAVIDNVNINGSTIGHTSDTDLLTLAAGALTVAGNVTLNARGDVRFADSDSSNWVAFQAPATVASNVTWTLPDADATTSGQALTSNASGVLSWADAGGVVQVKSAFTDAYTTHANTNVDNPADILSVSITPTSASNKILIMGLFTGNSTNTNVQYIGVKLARGATEIGSGDATTRNSTEGELHSSDTVSGDYSKPTSVPALFLDSPSTTSATTYKLQAFANRFGSAPLDNSTLVQNSGGYDYNNKEQGVGACSLIVMEVTP